MIAYDEMIIFLVGPRGSGKSSLGGPLARKLDFAFYDTDALVEAQAGCSVARIVAEEGWEAFRQREKQALLDATQPASVVATGGGMVLLPENRAHMRACGLVLHLAVPAEVLYQRLARGRDKNRRPSLTGADPLEEIAAILAEREPLYQAVAHHRLDASGSLPQALTAVMRILSRYKRKEL